jgi:hypothetical protein
MFLTLNWLSRRSCANPYKGEEGAEFGRQQNLSPRFRFIYQSTMMVQRMPSSVAAGE